MTYAQHRALILHELSSTTSPVLIDALTSRLDKLTKEDNQRRVYQAMAQDKAELPIKCGLSAKTAPTESTPNAWHYSTAEEKKAKLFEKTRAEYKAFFNHEPDKPTIAKLVACGGWKKGMKAFGLSFLLDVTEEIRKENPTALLEMFNKAIN